MSAVIKALGFVKRTCIFSGIQLTRNFIEFVVVETNQSGTSDSNIILTLQTFFQRSGMAAGGKPKQTKKQTVQTRKC